MEKEVAPIAKGSYPASPQHSGSLALPHSCIKDHRQKGPSPEGVLAPAVT